MIRKYIISAFLLFALWQEANAQHWQKIFTIPTVGSAAFFYNPDVGCIGTGNYPGGYPAQIFYTTDGGKSWTRSLMPNMNLFGQITDIYFTGRYTGWATMRERIEHGWSGIYKTTDGGKSWDLWFQAEFPVAIRQTSRGIFFTDRYVGIRRSTDGGVSFQTVQISTGALGLDFLDDNVGVSSGEGTVRAPTFITKDGGNSWFPFDSPHEGWTSYADVATSQLFFASERNLIFPSTESVILGIADNGSSFTTRFSGSGDAITGGIEGPRWCKSVIYAQGQDSTTKINGVSGMMRSTDGGKNWLRVGGPSNYNDKRFAVTGKGAIVYAFDKNGGVWKTTDGGDGTLTASSLGRISLSPLSPEIPLVAKLCDSIDFRTQLQYSDCDSLIISRIAFLDDNIGELSMPTSGRYFGKGNTTFDTLTIRFKPRVIHSATERIRITFRQQDGFTQDTIITIKLQSLASSDIPFIAEAAPTNTMDFGARSDCGDDSVRTITITNIGCSPLPVLSLSTSGAPFNLLSSFSPFTLDAGESRQVLLQFKPGNAVIASGKLTLITASSNTVIILSGSGKIGVRGYKLSQPQITSTICDSTEGDLFFKNISCNPIRLDSIGVDLPFRLDPIKLPAVIKNDSSILLHFHFVPNTDGSFSNIVAIHSTNNNDTNQRFDTTLILRGLATRGNPGILLSIQSLDFGSVNTCSYRDEEITITNTGCDTLKITDELFKGSSTGYTIIQSSKGLNILRGASAKIVIRFKPLTLGNYNSILHLLTNAGDQDITLVATGTNDPGTLSLNVTSIGSVLTCKDSGFVFTLSNTTCDSLTLDSIVFIGTGSSDYLINPISKTPMPSGKVLLVAGRFIPQGNGARTADAHFYVHLPNGLIKEIIVTMDGMGIQPVVIQLSLPNVHLTAKVLENVLIPVQLLDPSVIEVAKIHISLDLNTDLLEPQSFDMTGSVINGTIVSPLLLTKTNVSFTLSLPTPQKLGIGLLGTLILHPFVSDSVSTPIVLTDFTAFNSSDSKECLPTAIVTPPQIVTSFSLNSECGDSSLTAFLNFGISSLMIEKITPNPTSSKISVTLRIPPDYKNDGIIEIFDALGNRIQSEPLIVSAKEQKASRVFSLEGASGLRLLRVRTPRSIISTSVYLLR